MSTSSIVNETMKQINLSLKDTHPGYSCKTVSWEDATRGTFGGMLSSVGPNITDVRLYAKDKTQLFTVRSDNWNEKLGKVSSDDVCLIVEEDAGSGDLVPITLTNYLKNISKYGAYTGIKAGTDLYNPVLDKEISIRFQTTFLPVPDTEFGNVEFNVENYNYQTRDASDPRNMLLLCTTQGAALQQDGPGAVKLFHHAFDSDENKIHRYWFECERTKHVVGGMQVETEEEKEQALARGKATSSVIGIKAMGTRFNVLMSIQIPVQQRMIPQSSYGSSNSFGSFGGYSKAKTKTLSTANQVFSYSQPPTLECESFIYTSMPACAPPPMTFSSIFDSSTAPANLQQRSLSLKKRKEEKKIGKASAARVSRGNEYDTWSGLTKKDPVRDPSQHITITVVVYNVVAGGIPSVEDVQASVNDLNQLYRSCEWSGKLASDGADFMKSELTVNNVQQIQQKVTYQPYKPPSKGVKNGNMFPT